MPLIIEGRLIPITTLGIVLGLWILFATLFDLYLKVKKTSSFKLPRSTWGMLVAHIGVAVATLGIAVSKGYGIEADLRMQAGSKKQLGSYVFKMINTKDVQGQNYQAVDAQFNVFKDGKLIVSLQSSKKDL